MTTAPPPSDDGRLADLRELLRRAGYDAPTLRDALQGGEAALSRPWERPGQLHRLESRDDLLATLALLFTLGEGVGTARVDRQLAPLDARALTDLRLARVDGETVVPLVKIVPHDDVLIASDVPDEDAPADFVAAVHKPSHTLASLTVRRGGERALDLGTGNGIQALLTARHAEHVVATDVNERALGFARVSAVLNDVSNVEFRNGSFFEPVAGERFDLVATNPPYVISPESQYLFRDSGLGRDRVSEHVVRGLPAMLADGGYASVMVSWIVDGDDVAARPREWLEGSGCDALLLLSAVEDPISTATAWNRSAGSPDEIAERVQAWLDYYADEGIEALAYATIVLRRRDGENWLRHRPLAGELGSASDQLQRMFAAQATLASDDARLLDSRYRFVESARVVQALGQSGGWSVREMTLALEEGLGFQASLDEVTGAVVLGLDPTRPYRELLRAIGGQRGIERATIEQGGAHLLRQMLELGFVVPA